MGITVSLSSFNNLAQVTTDTGTDTGTGTGTGIEPEPEDGKYLGPLCQGEACPPQYDKTISKTTKKTFSTEVDVNAKSTSVVKWVLEAKIMVNGKYSYEYEITETRRIQTSKSFCNGYQGECKLINCGE